MKYLKRFNEGLDDDFNQFVKDKSGDTYNTGYQVTKFVKALTDNKLKTEFKYRLTDGEDAIDLIEEFVDKVTLSDSDQFNFRSLVMHKRLEEIESKYNEGDLKAGKELIVLAIGNGIDSLMVYLIGQMKENKVITPDRVIELLQVAIDCLEENNKLISWTYQRESWNPNAKSINAGKELIEELKKLENNELY
jgi:hypothetical protein